MVVSGGSSVPPRTGQHGESAFGAGFSIVYGQTEASPVITQTSPADTPEDKSETVGLALPQVEVKISDVVTGDSVPLGEQGEICARGYLVMTEYFRNPEASSATVDKDWVVAYRRFGDDGSTRIRPGSPAPQGHDHPRRGEHLSA